MSPAVDSPMRTRQRKPRSVWGQSALAIPVIWLGLVTCGVWAAERMGVRAAAGFAVPVWPALAVHVNTWGEEAAVHDDYFISRVGLKIAVPRTVALWVHDQRTGALTRLVTFRLPVWPLVVLSLGALLAFFGAATWRSRLGQQ